DLVGLLGEHDPLRLAARGRRIEQAELDLRGVFGEEGEIDAATIPRSPERMRQTGPNAHEHATPTENVSRPLPSDETFNVLRARRRAPPLTVQPRNCNPGWSSGFSLRELRSYQQL